MTLSCASCSDCADAATKAASWCTTGTMSGSGDLGTGGGTSPDAVCASMLLCFSNHDPGAFTASFSTYGPNGGCWQNASTAQACHDACDKALSQYQQSGECCLSDGDCRGKTPHCDTTTLSCEACPYACCSDNDCDGRGTCDPTAHACTCASDDQCTLTGATVCDPQTRTCAACTSGCCSARDCSDPGKPACDTSSHQCVGCVDSSQCGGVPFLSPTVCDPSSHACVQCVSDSDCANQGGSLLGETRCSAAHTCVECTADAQCATGHCSAGGACVCLSNADCGGRTCHTDSGLCDQCASDTDCTDASLAHCGLSSQGNKTCGQCAVANQCPSSPNCVDQTCTNKQCFTDRDCGSLFYCNANGQCQGP